MKAGTPYAIVATPIGVYGILFVDAPVGMVAMFFSTPMTTIVVLVLIVCVVVGVGILVRVMSDASGSRKSKVCGRCRTRNAAHAEFCAQCGKPLDGT